jgi:hypothetical protein
VSIFTGTRTTDRDIEMGIQRGVRKIVLRLTNGEIDPPDATRQLIDLLVRAVNAKTRLLGREGVE